jgi:hypothetical protein
MGKRVWMISLLLFPAALGQDRSKFPVNDHHIVYHDVRVDAGGGIVPWSGDDPSVAYDRNIRAIWNFWIHMRKCSNGVPYYLQHQVWKPDADDERGLGGDQINMALDSWNLLYDYLGDPAIAQNMILMADYWLDHGMSSPTALWANLPFPYNTDIHSGQYDGDMRAGKGYLQPDKAGSFGAELVMLYKMTGNPRYLDGAVKIADSLVAHVISGDATHSPWPFRVNATTGQIAEQEAKGERHTAAYTSNWSPTLRLFSGLEDLHRGDVAQYAHTAALVKAWIKTYPLATNKWGPFFEDIETAAYSDTEINADTMASYILEHPDWDRNVVAQAGGILGWSMQRLGNHSFEKVQVVPINEQTVYLVPGNSHTSRHASVELLYCEKSGDCATRGQAVRRLNWATYSVDADGKNRYPNDDIWLTDGYGDYVRHYLRAMASFPELAPKDQDHLLRTSSVIRHIRYSPAEISYQKFDARSVERLKLAASIPKSVEGGTMQWDSSQKVLTIQSQSPQVTIQLLPRPDGKGSH